MTREPECSDMLLLHRRRLGMRSPTAFQCLKGSRHAQASRRRPRRPTDWHSAARCGSIGLGTEIPVVRVVLEVFVDSLITVSLEVLRQEGANLLARLDADELGAEALDVEAR